MRHFIYTTERINLYSDLLATYDANEISGTTAYDANGNNNALISGCTINQTGKINKCYLFGQNDVVVTPFTNLPNELTFSCWFYKTGSGGGKIGRLYMKGSLGVYIDSNNTVYINIPFTTYKRVYVSNIATNNVWHHILVYINLNSALVSPIIYFDGTQQKLTVESYGSGTIITDTYNLYIGNRQNLDRNFEGYIDSVSFWGRKLNEFEVIQLYNNSYGIEYNQY